MAVLGGGATPGFPAESAPAACCVPHRPTQPSSHLLRAWKPSSTRAALCCRPDLKPAALPHASFHAERPLPCSG